MILGASFIKIITLIHSYPARSILCSSAVNSHKGFRLDSLDFKVFIVQYLTWKSSSSSPGDMIYRDGGLIPAGMVRSMVLTSPLETLCGLSLILTSPPRHRR